MSDITYAYDAAGRLASATYPDGTVVSYGARSGTPAPQPAPAATAAPAAETSFCMRCGARNQQGDRFCVKCGAPLG